MEEKESYDFKFGKWRGWCQVERHRGVKKKTPKAAGRANPRGLLEENAPIGDYFHPAFLQA
jgi:hypothetical protein